MSFNGYSFTSKKPSRAMHIAIILCYAVGVLLYGTSNMEGVPLPVIFQLATIVLIGIGTYLLFRFVLKKFTYEICADENGGLDLTVTETVGKKQTVVARMALDKISRADVIEKSAIKNELSAKGKPRPLLFRYDVNPFYQRVILVEFPSENSWVIIPEDKTMEEILKSNIGRRDE